MEYYKIRTDLILKLLVWNNEKSGPVKRALINYLHRVSGVSKEDLEASWLEEKQNDDDNEEHRPDDPEDDSPEAQQDFLASKRRIKGRGIFGTVLNYFIRLEFQVINFSHSWLE